MSFVDALCISSGFNCNHFSNIIDCQDGRILYSADMVLVINLFVTKNKFTETNFTTSKDAKISCKERQLKAVSVILFFIATIAMSCCFKQIWQDSKLSSSVLSTIYCSSKNGLNH